MCYIVNHERKLLHNLREGLLVSEPRKSKYIINVTFQKEKRNQKYEKNRKGNVCEWRPDKKEIESFEKNVEKRFKDNKKMRENRIKYASNKIRAATETDMINPLAPKDAHMRPRLYTKDAHVRPGMYVTLSNDY